MFGARVFNIDIIQYRLRLGNNFNTKYYVFGCTNGKGKIDKISCVTSSVLYTTRI